MTQPLPPGVPPAFKHYRLVRLLGQGGMGSVFEGIDERIGQRVAVKVLHPHLAAADPTFTERFEREAHMAALLRSPYTVHLLDFGEQDGRCFMVMEFIDGQSLADVLRQGPMEPNRALWVAGEVARALEEAGARGIVHRDIKPDNILFDQDGRVKVTDFGIARSMTSGGLTVAGGFLGTPAYAAPEQADGNVDQRSDIYSAGITLFAMLTGRPPYSGPTPIDVMMQHRSANLPMEQIQYLPSSVQNIVRRACEKDPLDRYQTASEMAGAIDRARQSLQRGAATGAGAAAAASMPPTARTPSQPPATAAPAELAPTAVAPPAAQPRQPDLVATQVASTAPPAAPLAAQAAGPDADGGGGGKRKVVYFYAAGVVAAVAAAVGLAIFLSSGGGDEGGGDATPTATLSPTPPIAAATDFEVTAVEFTYDRPTLLAPPNTQVTYTLHNEGSARHSLQFKDQVGGQELAPGATGPVTDGGQSSQVTFTTPGPGTYYFECVNHPTRMNGAFEVKDGAPAPATSQASPTGSAAEPVSVNVAAVDLAFDKAAIEVPTGAKVTVNLSNGGSARHSIQFLTAQGGQELAPGATGNIINGGQTDAVVFTAPAPGSYYFECAVHPGAMNGTLTVTSGGTAAATATPLPSVTAPAAVSQLSSGVKARPIAAVNLTQDPSGSATVLKALQASDRLIVVTNTPPNSTFHLTEGLIFWRVVIEGTQTVGWVPEVTQDGSTRFLERVD